MQPTSTQLSVIEKVIDRIAPKYVFGFYTIDDIKQESFIICLGALERYDNSRPFENFISRHLSNRLKSLIRDNYSRTDLDSERHAKLNESKKNLVDLQSLGNYETETDNIDALERLSTQEALEKVMDELSPSMRNDFRRQANGVSIQSARRQSLSKRVKEILGEDW